MGEPETLRTGTWPEPLDATTLTGAPEHDGPLKVFRHVRPDGRQLMIVSFDEEQK